MSESPRKPPRISVIEGRARLRAAHFKNDASAGQFAELWVAANGEPALIAYVGPPWGEYFSEESLENALKLA